LVSSAIRPIFYLRKILISISYKYIYFIFRVHFPTLIVCGFIFIASLLSLFSGLILSTSVAKDRQEFEFRLQEAELMKKVVSKLED